MGKNMSDDKNNGNVNDQQNANNEHDDFKPKSEDEIRQDVISEHDFDEEADKDLIDKLTNKEVEHQKSLSTAINQKIKWRSEAEEKQSKLEEIGNNFQPKNDKGDEEKPITQTQLNETLEEERLADMNVSDDIKKEIRIYSKQNNVSVKEAQNSDYIKFKINQEQEASKNDEASIGSGNKSGRGKVDYSSMSIKDAKENLSEEEWVEYKKANGMQ